MAREIHKCIGSYEDTHKDKMYYFVFSNLLDHYILEYDLITDTVSEIFRDCMSESDNLFLWRENFLITEINKIGDILYFTSDRYGEPQEINVVKSKESMKVINQYGYVEASSQIMKAEPDKYYPYSMYTPNDAGAVNNYPYQGTRDVKRQYVEVKKRPPYTKPSVSFDTNSSIKKNNIFGKSFQFRYRYHFYDKQVTEWSRISDATHTDDMKSNVANLNYDASSDNIINIRYIAGNHQVEYIELCARICKDFDVDKQGNRGDFFVIAKVKNDYDKFLNEESLNFSFFNDKIYPFADKNDIAKIYDNVPKRARTQTLISDNRISYANYLEGFDVESIDVELQPKYGGVTSSDKLSAIIYPGWTVNSSGQLSGGWSGSNIDNQKSSAYADRTTSGSPHSITLKNTSISNLVGLAQDASKTWEISSKGLEEGDSNINIVIGPYNSSYQSRHQYGPYGGQFNVAANYNRDDNGQDGHGTDKETYKINQLVKYPGNDTIGARQSSFCGTNTGGTNGYPQITFAFYYGDIETSENQIVNINASARFACRVQNPGNTFTRDKVQDSKTHIIDIQKSINTASSGIDFSDDASGLDQQMIYVAEQLGATYSKYSSISDKPDNGDYAWLHGPYVDTEKKILVLPLISNTKNSFIDIDEVPQGGGGRKFRLICVEEHVYPENNPEIINGGGKKAGISLNFNNPTFANEDPQLSGANKDNTFAMEVIGVGGGDGKSGSFKAGAFHDFGIIYYDGKGRNSTVAIDSENGTSKCYVKFFSERGFNADESINPGQSNNYGKARIDWSVNHQPPVWAKYWSWAYSKNTSVDEFIQFICPGAFTSTIPATGESRIFLSLQSLKGSPDSYRTQNNPLIDYSYVDGDRIRFITSPWNYDTPTAHTDVYIDVAITGYDLYNGSTELGEPLEEQGYFITIDSIDSLSGGTYDHVLTSSSTANFFGDGLFEIYRPLKESEDESTRVYYEFGFKHTIANAHENSRAHRGMTHTQVVGVSPARGYFDEGDVFFKRRIMRNSNNDTEGLRFTTSFVEDYHLNDFYPTNHINIGRPNVFNPYAREELKESSITYSEPFQPDVNYNGLSTFELFSYSDLDKADGSIQKIHSRDTDMVVIQEDRTYKVSINKDIITNADGSANVGLSSNVLGNSIAFSEHYGISKNPESFDFNGNILYWVDIKKGAVLRLKGNELKPISKVNMLDYFRDKSELYREANPTAGFTYNISNWYDEPLSHKIPEQFNLVNYSFRILGAYNPKHNEYVITFPRVYTDNNRYDNDNVKWEAKMKKPEEQGPVYTITAPYDTIVWSEVNQRWTSFHSYEPEMYGKINRRFFSFKDGELWHHDSSSDHSTFYGETFETKLKFPFNGLPNKVKTYQSLTVDGTFAEDTTADGVNSGTKTSYDTTLDTNLSSTSIDKTTYNRKEGLLYSDIPFATGDIDGEPGNSEFFGLGNITTAVDSTTVTLADTPNNGVNVGDNIYFSQEGGHTLIGTIQSIGATTYTLTSNANSALTSSFAYVIKSGEAEGDRMKGNFMNVTLTKRTKKPIEIYSVNSNNSKSELSEE